MKVEKRRDKRMLGMQWLRRVSSKRWVQAFAFLVATAGTEAATFPALPNAPQEVAVPVGVGLQPTEAQCSL
ncbi:hypothetical protein [Variovorax sp. J31P207]|uniref:hypothetical protein n=1 Tax=Variovorax sp. J31P207 TaxID=3053510 RepID=UPI002575C898|nr:hypothetical protein [Variovorax sp. J31P207]MDM0066833.1 hypothetical protein [Variovorax sp. J31P207]